jgi:hypothetical protein
MFINDLILDIDGQVVLAMGNGDFTHTLIKNKYGS